MKQLTIYCSRDLEQQVVAVLDREGLEGYFRLGDAAGHRFLPPGEVPRSVTWEAVMLVVPGAEERRIDKAVAALRSLADRCEIEPCLRVVVGESGLVF